MAQTTFSGPILAGTIKNTTGTTVGTDVKNTGQVLMSQSFSFAMQIVYAVCVSSRITFHKDEIKKSNIGISIIICARNELSNLKQSVTASFARNKERSSTSTVKRRC